MNEALQSEVIFGQSTFLLCGDSCSFKTDAVTLCFESCKKVISRITKQRTKTKFPRNLVSHNKKY